ncbi:hypothetical protein Tco_0637293 [Tanacetum coccineum]
MDVRRIEEEVDPDFLSDAHSRIGPAKSGDSCESKVSLASMVYTKSKEEHESHLKMNLELLKKEKCHVKPNKDACLDEKRRYDGWSYLGVVIARPSTIWERANVVVDAWSRKGGVKPRRIDGQSESTFRMLENMFRACVRNLVVVGILTFHEAETGEIKSIVEMKLLEFGVGDHVMMKVSPWKGVVCFGKKGELAPRHESEKTAWPIVVRHELEKTAWPIMVRHVCAKVMIEALEREGLERP